MENILQYNGQDLEFEGEVITFQGGGQEQDDPRYTPWATANELGKERVRRLLALGYL